MESSDQFSKEKYTFSKAVNWLIDGMISLFSSSLALTLYSKPIYEYI